MRRGSVCIDAHTIGGGGAWASMGVCLELILHASEPTPFPLDLRVSVPRVSSTWTATSARGTMMEPSSRSMHRTGHLRGSTKVREQCAH